MAIREFNRLSQSGTLGELSESVSIKGHYRRAIERYKDALFYLNRETVKEDVRIPGAERIGREIELLKSRLPARKDRSEKSNSESTNSQEKDAGMISQRCPKCRSSSIRKGYKPTPLISAWLDSSPLCNHCHLLFTGFVVPGTVGRSSRKSRGQSRSDRNRSSGLSRAKDR